MADHPHRSGPVDLGIPGYTEAFEIGRGGFGVVYCARQPDLDRTVAIKVLTAGRLDRSARARFDRERQITGKLSDHPHIVTVFGSGFTPGGEPYIVMAYMSRGSLADRIDREGPLGWQEAAAVGVKLCRALEAAHEAKVLHRDVKPENVFVSAYGEPALGDFGIARIEGGMHTTDGEVIATVAHAAPEILSGRAPTVASDVYGLGSTIFALISGSPAHLREGDESIGAMIARIADEPVPDLRGQGVPYSLCRVIERAMAKSPVERQASAAMLGQELQRAMDRAQPGGQKETIDRLAPSVPGPGPPPGRQPGAPANRSGTRRFAVATVVLALVGAGLWALVARGDEEAVQPNDPSPAPTQTQGQRETSPPRAPVAAGTAIFQVAQGRDSEIIVINIDTDERQRVETDVAAPSRPSADATGERMAVTTELDDGSAIALRRSATEQFVVLPLPGDAHTPALSPDGAQMAFVSNAGGQDDIYVVDISSLEVERITDSSSPEFDPVWEPTGERIAFVRQGSRSDVIVIALPDGSVDATIETPGRKSSPAWSPVPVDERSHIAFVGEVSGQRRPQTADPATGGITRTVATSNTPLALTWMADLRLLVVLAGEGLVLIGPGGGPGGEVEKVDASLGAAAPRWFGGDGPSG